MNDKENPQRLLDALDVLTQSHINHAKRAFAAGASGILFSMPLARALYPNDSAEARFASTNHNSLPVEHEAQSELKQRHRIQGLGCN